MASRRKWKTYSATPPNPNSPASYTRDFERPEDSETFGHGDGNYRRRAPSLEETESEPETDTADREEDVL